MFAFFRQNYPHIDSDIAGSVDEVLSVMETAGQLQANIKTILAKKSLSHAQKLAYITTLIFYNEDELVPSFLEKQSTYDDEMIHALMNEDATVVLERIE